MDDAKIHGAPQTQKSHISRPPMKVNPVDVSMVDKLPTAPLCTLEMNVVKKCIVLIEYYPQSTNQENRLVLPTLVTGGPVYGRVGQRVWIGHAYKLVHPDLAILEGEVDIGIFKSPEHPKSKQVEMNNFQPVPARLKGGNKVELMWDWEPATDNEVVEATRAIMGTINPLFNATLETPDGVQTQSWECTKCSEGEPRVGQGPRKKWTFVVHYRQLRTEKVRSSKMEGRKVKAKKEPAEDGKVEVDKSSTRGNKLALRPVAESLE